MSWLRARASSTAASPVTFDPLEPSAPSACSDAPVPDIVSPPVDPFGILVDADAGDTEYPIDPGRTDAATIGPDGSRLTAALAPRITCLALSRITSPKVGPSVGVTRWAVLVAITSDILVCGLVVDTEGTDIWVSPICFRAGRAFFVRRFGADSRRSVCRRIGCVFSCDLATTDSVCVRLSQLVAPAGLHVGQKAGDDVVSDEE